MFEDPVETPGAEQMLLAIKMRQLRDRTLNETVDRVNPIRYAELTDSQRTELAAYRQTLLALPDQPGFPNTIVWPNQPTWL